MRKNLKPSYEVIEEGPQTSQWMSSKIELEVDELKGKWSLFCLTIGQTSHWLLFRVVKKEISKHKSCSLESEICPRQQCQMWKLFLTELQWENVIELQ